MMSDSRTNRTRREARRAKAALQLKGHLCYPGCAICQPASDSEIKRGE